MSRGLLYFSGAVAILASAGACAPVTTYNGFPVEASTAAIQEPQVGVDTRDTVQARFGTPSTTAVLDQTAWYYLSEVQQRVAFYNPHITDRHVMVVRFDGDTVSGVEKYGIERGRIIAYDRHITPTRGRELGIIEQLLGNVGNTAPINPNDDQDDPRRREH